MGLIENVPVPRVSTDADRVSDDAWYKYQDEFWDTREKSMATLKDYYEKLLEAKYAVAAYIISLDHSDESLDFSIKQLNMSLEGLQEIEDENKKEEEQKIKDNITLCTSFKKINESKRNQLNLVDAKLSTYIENTITKNNLVENASYYP